MKMAPLSRVLVSLFVLCAAGSQEGLRGSQLAAGPSPAPGPSPGPAAGPPDNFHDELTDQANPEFDMADLDKDGCITWEEANKTVTEGARAQGDPTCPEFQQALADLHAAAKEAFTEADKDLNGCVDEHEFDNEPSDGFDIGECESQFKLMDSSGDGQVSQNEAFHHASEHMDNADINAVTLMEMFSDADTNGDNFLSKEEFCDAGDEIEGDGANAFFLNVGHGGKHLRKATFQKKLGKDIRMTAWRTNWRKGSANKTVV